MSMSNKTVTLKDIHNIWGKAAPTFGNDFQELMEEMKKVKGAVSIIGTVKPSLNTFEPTWFWFHLLISTHLYIIARNKQKQI